MLIDESLIGFTSVAAGDAAARAEAAGFDRVWATESVTDGFLQAFSACRSTEGIDVGTAIVVAFARNPMSTAYAAWDLAATSNGRFTLGLGTQVRQHIERRFSMPWSDPVERLRDYIAALRAIFEAWRSGGRLDHQGPYYHHTLMNPVFTPPRHHHDIPIAIAAVGPRMARLAGEVCDGVILHGMTTTRYLDDVTLPALRAGEADGGRPPRATMASLPVFMAMGDSAEQIERERDRVRQQIAFYASTPAYKPVLESVGYGDLQAELQQLTRRGDWAQMSRLIDERLESEIALVGTPEQMPVLAHARFGGRVDRVSSYFGWPPVEPDRLADILAGFHQADTSVRGKA